MEFTVFFFVRFFFVFLRQEKGEGAGKVSPVAGDCGTITVDVRWKWV